MTLGLMRRESTYTDKLENRFARDIFLCLIHEIRKPLSSFFFSLARARRFR